MSSRKAFTLVELLVVIGIIALLISILLPALGKARDQANTVACESTMRQVYNYMNMYQNDYKGSVMPARQQISGTEPDWYTFQFLGREYGRYDSNSGTTANIDTATVIKMCLRCPAADHSSDPVVAKGLPEEAYYGDYVYNGELGTQKWDSTNNVPFYPAPYVKWVQVPGNVIVMTDCHKPNLGPAPSYSQLIKPYFDKWSDLLGSGAATPRVGTPHLQNKKCNMLFMDGHIATVDPYKDSLNPDGTTKDYLITHYKGADATKVPTPPILWNKGLPGL